MITAYTTEEQISQPDGGFSAGADRAATATAVAFLHFSLCQSSALLHAKCATSGQVG